MTWRSGPKEAESRNPTPSWQGSAAGPPRHRAGGVIRVVLIDDHPIVRVGIRALLQTVPGLQVVGEASDCVEGLSIIRALQPDVAILDVSLPQSGGLEMLQHIIEQSLSVKVLFLTFHENPLYARKLLEIGARGYILKRSAGQDLIRAVQMVAAGEKYIDPAVAGSLLEVAEGARREQQESILSKREREILKLVASGHSNKEISARFLLNIKTIETYRARACEKLNLRSRAEIVRYGLSKGWLTE